MDYLLLVEFELGSVGFSEGDCDACDAVHVWAALQTGEDSCVDLALKVVLYFVAFFVFCASDAIEDECSSCSSKSLVSSCRNDVCMREW